MRIGRTIPPAASPLHLSDIFNGLKSIIRGRRDIERFEAELKEHFKVNHVSLVSSGKAALTIILKSLHKLNPDRNEVLMPAFCCYSVPSAIIRAGLKIRLCDVNPDNLDFDFDEFKRLLSESISENKLLAVLAVHLFGLSSDIERIREMLADPNIKVVEDAAQVMGSERNGQKLGTIGDVGFFSLGRSKSISAVEGGIILTTSDEIASQIAMQLEAISEYSLFEKAKLLFQAIALLIFQSPSLFWFPKALPFLRVGDTIYNPDFKIRKLSGFQASLAKNWKAKLFDYSKFRRDSALKWSSMFDTEAISDYVSLNGEMPNFIRYPVRLENNQTWEQVLRQSETQGLGIQLTYPDSINGISELCAQFADKDFPAAAELTRKILTLPVHPLLSLKDKNKIQSLFKSLLAKLSDSSYEL